MSADMTIAKEIGFSFHLKKEAAFHFLPLNGYFCGLENKCEYKRGSYQDHRDGS